MPKLTDYDKNILALIQRTPNRGDGWRNVNNTIWPIIQRITTPELIELNHTTRQVRLTPKGQTIVEYTL